MENRKIIGLVLIIVAVVPVILNFVVIYPYINCNFAPLVFWFIAFVCVVGGIIIYFNIKIFHSEESQD
ncbi:MAG: hypothetical protein ACFFEN_06195 [Candidatus Thorarchaeota archaeon]